jgi:hypothetical protein
VPVGQPDVLVAMPGVERLVRREMGTGDPGVVVDVAALDLGALGHMPLTERGRRRVFLQHDDRLTSRRDNQPDRTPGAGRWAGVIRTHLVNPAAGAAMIAVAWEADGHDVIEVRGSRFDELFEFAAVLAGREHPRTHAGISRTSGATDLKSGIADRSHGPVHTTPPPVTIALTRTRRRSCRIRPNQARGGVTSFGHGTRPPTGGEAAPSVGPAGGGATTVHDAVGTTPVDSKRQRYRPGSVGTTGTLAGPVRPCVHWERPLSAVNWPVGIILASST